MDYFSLGQTGINVSSLCFGTLPMGPLQAGMPAEEGGTLILKGLEAGINFVDTAELYRTYDHVRWALERFDGKVVIAGKSTAVTYEDMKNSVEKCLNELKRDYIDIFHLHAARDGNPLETRKDALAALLDCKKKGLIKAVGLANHSVKGITSAVHDDRIDIIFTIVNRTGIGILDGSIDEMTAIVREINGCGKGLYAMKALGGGTLLDDVPANLNFVRKQAGIPVVAVGMVTPKELEMNLALFNGLEVPEDVLEESRRHKKKAQVLFLCKGCGRCAELCHNDAISMKDGKAFINPAKCLLCGYCSRECPQFAIRVV